MRKCILVLLMAFSFIFSAQAAPPAGSTNVPITAVIVADQGTPLYLQPMETAEAAGQLQKGAAVTVDVLGLYWCHVTDGSQAGYVPAGALHLEDWGTVDPGAETGEGGPKLAVFNVGMSPLGHWTMTLRESADRKAAKMDTYIGGTVMVALEKGKEYSLVHVGDKIGYLLTKYLTFYDTAQTPVRYAIVSNDADVNLRFDRRFGDSGIITALHPGTAVTLIWEKKGWACVEVDGYQGYIVSEFLEILD